MGVFGLDLGKHEAFWDLMGGLPSGGSQMQTVMMVSGKPTWGDKERAGVAYVSTPVRQAIPHGFFGTGYVPIVVATATSPGNVVTIDEIDEMNFYARIDNPSTGSIGLPQYINWIAALA